MWAYIAYEITSGLIYAWWGINYYYGELNDDLNKLSC